MRETLRIAYLGPSPRRTGGVAGVAALVLDELLALGHEIDCYVAGTEAPLPNTLHDHPSFTLFDGKSPFRYDTWYSKTELTKFLSGQAVRALIERRLAGTLSTRHRMKPYDVVYQFSHVEVFKLGNPRNPPLVVHPETHSAGELRWLKLERPLARRCESYHRRLAAQGILAGRTFVQRRHAKLPVGFICPGSAFQREFCADYAVDHRLTRVIPNPIDLALFRPRHDISRPDEPVKLLFVSRISVRKGVESIVELSRRLADLARSVTLEVVGGRTQWSDYSRLLDGLDPRIATYRGSMPPEDIPTLMADADVLLQPSKYEPFGLTVGEALASGVPVVVTPEVGAAENVSPECARIIPVGDAAALEREVRLLVRQIQDGQRRRLAACARAEAERLFDPRDVGKSVSRALLDFSTNSVTGTSRRARAHAHG